MSSVKWAALIESTKYLGRTRPNGVQHFGREDKIWWSLFPPCAGAAHVRCEPMIPKIGTDKSPRKFLGWNHCSCKCHVFKKTKKNGWSITKAMVKVPNV